MNIKKALLLTIILLCGNVLWYYRWGNDFRVDQSYRGREILSSSYKVTVYLVPAVWIFRSYRKQSWTIHRKSRRGRGAIGLATAMIWVKSMLYWFTWINPNNALLTVMYVLIINSVIEEYVFRWLLFSSLQKDFSSLKANLIQTVLFWIVHLPFYISMGRSWFSLVWAILWVMCLWFWRGYIKKDTWSLFYPVLFHSIWNGILVFL